MNRYVPSDADEFCPDCNNFWNECTCHEKEDEWYAGGEYLSDIEREEG